MTNRYNPIDHYWIVAGDDSRLWSSKRAAYIPAADATYQAWLATGRLSTRIANEDELWEVLAKQFPAGLDPANAVSRDIRQGYSFDAMDIALMKVAFNHENRIRALEAKGVITAAQFKTAVKALL